MPSRDTDNGWVGVPLLGVSPIGADRCRSGARAERVVHLEDAHAVSAAARGGASFPTRGSVGRMRATRRLLVGPLVLAALLSGCAGAPAMKAPTHGMISRRS